MVINYIPLFTDCFFIFHIYIKNKIQYGGFRFRDIITQENLDKHIGKEVEIISLWGEHAKNELDKLTANTVGPGNHDMAHTWRYLTEEGRRYRYIDLINFTGILQEADPDDVDHRDNLAEIRYPHLIPDPIATVHIPTNLHEYFHGPRVPGTGGLTYPNLLYLIKLKKPEDRLSDAIRAKFEVPPRRYHDIFTADNISRIKRRNIFNPELETRRFINSPAPTSPPMRWSRRRKTKKKDSGKRRFTVTKDSVKYPSPLQRNPFPPDPLSRDANLYMDLLRGEESEKIYLTPDILELLRRSI